MIWKEMNDFIFNRGNPSFHSWKLGFLDEAVLQANKMREDKKLDFLVLLTCIDS
jgi:hypothetical protein